MDSYIDNPVFLCGHRKAGTTMLVNLLDDVDGLITYPDDSGFFYRYFPRYENNNFTDKEKIKRLSDVIIKEKLTEIIDEIDCSKDLKKQLIKNQNIFFDKMMKYGEVGFSYKDILLHFISSFKEVYYPKKNAKAWVEKTTSTEIYALELSKKFPKAKFIHIIRDPRDNFGSLLSGWDKKYNLVNDSIERLLQSTLDRGLLGMQCAKNNSEILGKERYKVIKFEDITSNTDESMKDIANFIGVAFDNKMLNPTIFGHSWYGNNFSGVKITSPSSFNVSKWKQRIEEHQAKIIEFYFKDIMDYFEYNREFSLEESQLAASEFYKWSNFSSEFSDK
jgi:hypothetical protein